MARPLQGTATNNSSKQNEFEDINYPNPITAIISAKEGVIPKKYMMEI